QWLTNRSKLILAKRHKVGKVLIVDFDIEQNIKENEHSIQRPQMKLANAHPIESMYAASMYISPGMAAKIMSVSEKKFVKRTKKFFKGSYEKRVYNCRGEITISRAKQIINSQNVLGFIEGTDKKDEIVVLTAHYDHLGKHGDIVYNGADDDGSGTVALLEIAESFKKAKDAGFGPRRSILIMPVSGEEKGLLGSEYYSSNPVFPLKNTVVDFNIDMIGRIDEKHKGNADYVYLIGSDKLSSEVHRISEETNKIYTQLELDYTFNDPNDPNKYYYRSDHYNFAKHNIPVIFYFNGTHEDYHRPSDTFDKIDYDKIEKITKLVFYTAWNIANGDTRPPVDVKNDFDNSY
ncbi:MAG: M28 family peptidase, partial [Flavobacteriales bacterium]|nr:M28 family peptidase [Flavobacteriales bacterium]